MIKNTRFLKKYTNIITILFIGVLIGLLLLLASYWAGRTWQSHQIPNKNGYSLPSPAVDFSLMAATGEWHSIRALGGNIILLSFGATTCYQTCEDMLSKLASARTNLGTDEKFVQVIILTLDSDQDTPVTLDKYVQNFDPSFLALSGSQQDLYNIARSYNVFYTTINDYQPAAMLIDHQGQWQKAYTLETSEKEITIDMQHFLSNH